MHGDPTWPGSPGALPWSVIQCGSGTQLGWPSELLNGTGVCVCLSDRGRGRPHPAYTSCQEPRGQGGASGCFIEPLQSHTKPRHWAGMARASGTAWGGSQGPPHCHHGTSGPSGVCPSRGVQQAEANFRAAFCMTTVPGAAGQPGSGTVVEVTLAWKLLQSDHTGPRNPRGQRLAVGTVVSLNACSKTAWRFFPAGADGRPWGSPLINGHSAAGGTALAKGPRRAPVWTEGSEGCLHFSVELYHCSVYAVYHSFE